MDPITLLATASAIWSGLKKASQLVGEAEGIWGQLSKYCGVADQLEQCIADEKLNPKKPKLFAKQTAGNDVQEAFNAFEAEYKLNQMEAEIKFSFLYGDFCSLEGGYGGADGYAKFCNLRRKIRADRIKAKQEQQDLEREFWDNILLWVGGSTIILIGAMAIFFAVMAIIRGGT